MLHILDGRIVGENAQRKIFHQSLSDLSVEIDSCLLHEDSLAEAVKGKGFSSVFPSPCNLWNKQRKERLNLTVLENGHAYWTWKSLSVGSIGSLF